MGVLLSHRNGRRRAPSSFRQLSVTLIPTLLPSREKGFLLQVIAARLADFFEDVAGFGGAGFAGDVA